MTHASAGGLAVAMSDRATAASVRASRSAVGRGAGVALTFHAGVDREADKGWGGIIRHGDGLILAGAVAAGIGHRPGSGDHLDHVTHASAGGLAVAMSDGAAAASVRAGRSAVGRGAGVARTFHTGIAREADKG